MDAQQVREFQKQLVRLHEQKGYSQAAFAQVVGGSARMMCQYEKVSDNLPPASVLVKMAEILGCSIDGLLIGQVGMPDGRTVEGRLLRRFQDAARLPETDRMLLVQMLDALLVKNGVDAASAG